MFKVFSAFLVFLFAHTSYSSNEVFRDFVNVDFFLSWISGKVKMRPKQDFVAGPFPSRSGVWKLVSDGGVVSRYGDVPYIVDAYWSGGDDMVSYSTPGIFSLELSDFGDGRDLLSVGLSYNKDVELFQGGRRVGAVRLGDFVCFAQNRNMECSYWDLKQGAFVMDVPFGGEWLVFGSHDSSIIIDSSFRSVASGYIDLNFKVL